MTRVPFDQAAKLLLDELARLPLGAWERTAAAESVNVRRSYAPQAAAWPDSDEKAIIMSARQLYEQIKNEGREEGRQEGREEGRKEGREQFLLRLLARRFGVLPDEVVARVHAAADDELDRWGERLVTAATLEEIFAPEP